MARIVVVDDEPVVAELLAMIFKSAGYDVATFLDPNQALRDLQRHHADIVVTDQCMPGMSGIDLANQIFDLSLKCHVFVLSGDRFPHPHGPLDFDWAPFHLLYKPIDPVDLLAIVARTMQSAA